MENNATDITKSKQSYKEYRNHTRESNVTEIRSDDVYA